MFPFFPPAAGGGPFNPAVVRLSTWSQGSYSGAPWVGKKSKPLVEDPTGDEGSLTNPGHHVTDAVDPTVGIAVNGKTPAVFGATSSLTYDYLVDGTYSIAKYNRSCGCMFLRLDADFTQNITDAQYYNQNHRLWGQASNVGLLYGVYGYRDSGVNYASLCIRDRPGFFEWKRISTPLPSVGSYFALYWGHDGTNMYIDAGAGEQSIASPGWDSGASQESGVMAIGVGGPVSTNFALITVLNLMTSARVREFSRKNALSYFRHEYLL